MILFDVAEIHKLTKKNGHLDIDAVRFYPIICENMVDAAITVSWDSDKLSNVERQRGFPFVDQNTTYGQSATGPARSTLKRPEVREAICASERASERR